MSQTVKNAIKGYTFRSVITVTVIVISDREPGVKSLGHKHAVIGNGTVGEESITGVEINIRCQHGFDRIVAAVDLLVFANGKAAVDAGVGKAALSALKTGVFFIVVLAFMGAVREIFGSATVAGFELSFLSAYKIPILLKAPGGFIVFSIIAGAVSNVFAREKTCVCSQATAAAGLPCCNSEEGAI